MKPLIAADFGGVARDARRLERSRRLAFLADPEREHRLRCGIFIFAMLSGRRDDRLRRVGRRRQRRRHVHRQHRVVRAVVEQIFKRGRIARRIGVAGDVDRIGARPDRRQRGVELPERLGRNAGEFAAEIGEAIDRQYADAAAVGENGKPRAGEFVHVTERLGGSKQFVQIKDAQQSGAAEGRVINRVRSRKRAGMGQRRFGAERLPAGFDHHHRLDARRGACGRHELPRLPDQFDVEQNRAGVPIHGEEIEQVGEINVDAVAERNHGRKSDAANRGPLHQPGGDGARLRNQREIARRAATPPRSWR